jgi:predicted nucleic acid-binding protein
MKEKILVSSDVIIEYLKTGKGKLPLAYDKCEMFITSTTYIEILASKTFTDASLEKEVLEFLKKYFSLVEVNKEFSLEAAKILRENELTLSASIFCAVAKDKEYAVLTNDFSDYEKVAGVNAFEAEK